MLLLALRTVLGDRGGLIRLAAARVGSDPFVPMGDLHRRQRRPNLHQLPGQRIGHTVVMAIKLDVIVDVDAGF